LKKHGAKWIDELLWALWTNQTSSSWATRETTFFLVYGAEAVILSEITMVSLLFCDTSLSAGMRPPGIEDGTPLPNPWNIEHLYKFYP
jgi:hypothetical protein